MIILVKAEVTDEIFCRYLGSTDVNGRKVNPFKMSSVYSCSYFLHFGGGIYFGSFFLFHFMMEMSSLFSLVSCVAAS